MRILMKIQLWWLERQIEGNFDPSLSHPIDAVRYLLEHEP
jgi:hypothetical protein